MNKRDIFLLVFAVAGIGYSVDQLYKPVTVNAAKCCFTSNDCLKGSVCRYLTTNCDPVDHGTCDTK
jgi:hypothetical protein